MVGVISFTVSKKPSVSSDTDGFSGLFDELFPALGAGDGDLALVPRNPDGLAAFGAVEIAVILIPQPLGPEKEPAVFLIALVGFVAEKANHAQNQQAIRSQRQNQIQHRIDHQHGDNHQAKAAKQDGNIEFIMLAVAARQEMAQRPQKTVTQLPEQDGNSVHTGVPSITKNLVTIIAGFFPKATARAKCLQIVSKIS